MPSNQFLWHEKMNKRALITGGTGFIGGSVARHLIETGWSVDLIIRKESDLSSIEDVLTTSTSHIYDGSTESLVSIVEKVRPDAVFHLASLVQVRHEQSDIVPLIMSNVVFGTQLLEAMVSAKVNTLVNAATIWQYSGGDERQAVNLYAATKQSFESIIDYYHDAFGVSAVSLVLSDTYGVGDRRKKLINFLICSVGERAVLNMSPGDQIIDLSHVQDVARSFELVACKLIESVKPVRESLAISGTRLSVKQLVAAVESVSQQKVNVEFGGRPYRAREIMCPAQLPELAPEWRRIELSDGIQELLDVYRKKLL